jgi:alkanesulfonate monooxygenase SsuD/methylene tetrahydromethanopterin reductase-like flavin-dependent oxidoreductase (luciferase family)
MFMMPVHPLHRNHTETLKEDREAVILATSSGYHDVFIGEHLTDQAENITNSLLFLATLIHSTKHIKLASGTCNLSQIHPRSWRPTPRCSITSARDASSWA